MVDRPGGAAAPRRRGGAGERGNHLDRAKVAEDVESVGRSEAQAVDSLMVQALVHAPEIAASPDQVAARKWRNGISARLVGARRRLGPSMAQQLDVQDIDAAARRLVLDLDMRRPPRPLPATTDRTPAELLDESRGAEALIARLAPR
ncbi:DUF29 family protein [Dankookia rubra]|uniref:DUF29 family protein n=1 Tax=Dankookia rubra TaxID=1442381 RepID=UPI00240CED24|nr:DUF29 family protein [Dankookia rubra]